MSAQGHVEALQRKHQELDDKIQRAESSPGANDLEIAEMKKAKLKIKDELSRLGH